MRVPMLERSKKFSSFTVTSRKSGKWFEERATSRSMLAAYIVPRFLIFHVIEPDARLSVSLFLPMGDI
jgi:hypothetical protein